MNLEDLIRAVIDGDGNAVSNLVAQGLDNGVRAEDILTGGLTPGIIKVGELFHNGEYFLPEMLRSAKAMAAGIKLIEPILSANESDPVATVILGTVQGDLHDIGKNILGMMMRGAGFKVIDLGVDVRAEQFIEKAAEQKAEIIAISALLSTTMPAMRATVGDIRGSSLGNAVKVLVGGAPVNRAFAEEIGADGYGEDAPEAVNRARALVGAA